MTWLTAAVVVFVAIILAGAITSAADKLADGWWAGRLGLDASVPEHILRQRHQVADITGIIQLHALRKQLRDLDPDAEAAWANEQRLPVLKVTEPPNGRKPGPSSNGAPFH